VGQMMRRSPAEKREIIDLVEHSALPVGRTLAELDVPRSSFYRWYHQYQPEGEQGVGPQPSKRRQFCLSWRTRPGVSTAPTGVRPDCPVGTGRAREVRPTAGLAAWRVRPGFTDQEGYFVSESSVFRLLKRFDLVESPVFQLVTAADRSAHPTHRANELWQTDFTYFKIQGWGWYPALPQGTVPLDRSG